MNVFGSSQASDTKNIITNIEQSFKTYIHKFDKIEHLLEENNRSIYAQEEQTKSLQLKCVNIAERLSKIEASLQIIRENTDGLKKLFPTILSALFTIDTYYKDKA